MALGLMEGVHKEDYLGGDGVQETEGCLVAVG